VEDHEAATLRHDQLVIPVVSVHRGVAAFPDDQLVHRGLPRAVLPADELPHLHVAAAFLQETVGCDRPDGGRVHAGRRDNSLRPLTFLRKRTTSRIRAAWGLPKGRFVLDGILDADLCEGLAALAAGDADPAMDGLVPIA